MVGLTVAEKKGESVAETLLQAVEEREGDSEADTLWLPLTDTEEEEDTVCEAV